MLLYFIVLCNLIVAKMCASLRLFVGAVTFQLQPRWPFFLMFENFQGIYMSMLLFLVWRLRIRMHLKGISFSWSPITQMLGNLSTPLSYLWSFIFSHLLLLNFCWLFLPTLFWLCLSYIYSVFFKRKISVWLLMNLHFFWSSDRLPPSPQEYPILGLNLLRLLVQNRIAEFHTELELLSSAALENPCIKHAVELEQSFMEGAYNRVLSARQTVPHETYVYFMDLLAKTVRYFVLLLYCYIWIVAKVIQTCEKKM